MSWAGSDPDPRLHPIVLDADHRCGFMGESVDGEPLLLVEWHRRLDRDSWCCSAVALEANQLIRPAWRVTSFEPLTLAPVGDHEGVIACRRCPSRGRIEEGRWLAA